MSNTRIRLVIRLLLAAVFIFTGISKLRSGPADINTIYGQSPVWVQTTLPYAELSLAGWLIWGALPRYAALTSIAALSLFSGVIGAELRKPDPKPCGCSNTAAAQDPAAIRRGLWFAIGRNGLLMTGGVWLLLSKPSSRHATVPVAEELIPSTV